MLNCHAPRFKCPNARQTRIPPRLSQQQFVCARLGHVSRCTQHDNGNVEETSSVSEETISSILQSIHEDVLQGAEDARGSRVAVIGAGSVGASCVNALIWAKVASDILLVDIDQRRCEGEVLDLSDSGYVTTTRVAMGTLEEAGMCDIVVVTAGAKQRPGETRLQLLERNVAIIESVCNKMKPFGDNTVLMIVANPVDVITTIAQQISGLPHNRVLGSGTYLDSMRFRGEIAKRLSVASSAVKAFVAGEHGDSQVACWSCATLAGIPLLNFSQFKDAEVRKEIADFARDKAYAIIERKGATYYGIAACVANLCDAILLNKRITLPVSTWNEDHRLYIGQNAVIGRNGIDRVLPLPLDDEEMKLFNTSAGRMKEMLQPLGFWSPARSKKKVTQ